MDDYDYNEDDFNNVSNSNLVEFLRFGSTIPGAYWGCCAGDIIQAFKTPPEYPNSCQAVNGDNNHPVMHPKGGFAYFGPTNLDLFLQRLRVGTFGGGDMPNHFFFLVLTDDQVNGSIGAKWLPILKREGFEYIRKVNNSVWNINNHIFGLIRNCGGNAVIDQFTPPKVWRDLPSNGKTELWEYIQFWEYIQYGAAEVQKLPVDAKALTKQYREVDALLFDKLPSKLLTEDEVRAAKAPVILAGIRSANPQELKETRDKRNASKKQEVSLRAETPQTGTKGA